MSDTALTELSELLAQLEETPQNVPLLLRSLDLLDSLNLDAEYIGTTNRLAALIMLKEDRWTAYFAKLLAQPLTLETLVDILEALDRSENDYYTAASFTRHAQFLVDAKSSEDPEIAAFLTDDTLRDMLQAVTQKAAGLLDSSHLVWNVWLEWETSRDDVDRIHDLYIERLQTPHDTIQATSDAYSTFCSTHAPNDYEARLVRATAAAQASKAVLAERRFGKARSDYEDALAAAEDKATVYAAYIDWEIRAKTPNRALAAAVYERAIASQAGTDAEAALWLQYVTWSADIDVYKRAVRARPGNGSLWAELFIELERQEVDISELFETALGIGILLKPDAPVQAILDIFIARASYDIRTKQDPLTTISRGLEAVAHLGGDPTCRLERFILEWGSQRSPSSLPQVEALVEKPNKSRASSWQMITTRASIASRHDPNIARHIYINSVTRSDLDWPEAVYEAFIQFENLHGTVDTLIAAKAVIRKEQAKVAKRREKAAAEQYQAYYEAMAPASADPAQVESTSASAPAPAAAAASTSASATAQPAKHEATDFEHLKRDRENTTILVSGLPSDITSARIESFFHDCGPVREITLVDAESDKSALVEFRHVDAIPPALARDRKKLDGHEVSVSMLWRSTLFVTNFDKNVDDEQVRELFGQHGFILSTRWPSLKYAGSRRFCYITMDNHASAHNALQLHGDKTLSKFGLSVLVSDPAAKKQRTDAGETTLFVGGLSPETTEEEVREQFAKHGNIHYVKLGMEGKRCKGWAFVDMSSEAEAKAALALDGVHLNGRFLRVSIKDPKHEKKKPAAAPEAQRDRRERSVRLHGLPENTQEGLLQQALEKIVPVKRLELFAKSHEALAELESQADTGKLLLRPEPFIFQGATITFTEQQRRAPHKPEPTALAFVPRTRKLGSGRKPNQKPPAFVPASGQDAFRALVEDKNKQREGNLAQKRGAAATDEADGPDAKRAKQ